MTSQDAGPHLQFEFEQSGALMPFNVFTPGGISLLTAATIWLVAKPLGAEEISVTLPPRTIPYGQELKSGQQSVFGPVSSQSSNTPIATRLIGITRPSQHAELRSAVGVPIIEVLVRTGDRVKSGDALIRLDDRIQQSAVKVAQVEAARSGAVSSALIEFQLAGLQLQRATLAFQRQAGSQFEVDEKTAARDEAHARVAIEQESQERARANLDRALAELEQYTIRAPFDGEIVQIHQRVGATADRSEPVITVADRRTLKVELHLPLTEFGTVAMGNVLTVQADSPVNRPVPARVTAVSPYINAASRTFRVELEIDNRNERLPAGFTIRQQETLGSGSLADRAVRPQISRQR